MAKHLEKTAVKVIKRLAKVEAKRLRIARRAFASIERYDPKTAKLAKQVLGGRDKAAAWFVEPRLEREVSFWDVIVYGDMPKVRSILEGLKR